MVRIDTSAHLESFRRFLVNSTCLSFIPESYLQDPEVFPEREDLSGSIYVEAADKVTLKRIRDITFVNATDILGVIYASKTGNSKLKWRQTRGKVGRVSGEASTNSLVNLFASRVISQEYADELMKGIQPTAPARIEPPLDAEESPLSAEEPGSAPLQPQGQGNSAQGPSPDA